MGTELLSDVGWKPLAVPPLSRSALDTFHLPFHSHLSQFYIYVLFFFKQKRKKEKERTQIVTIPKGINSDISSSLSSMFCNSALSISRYYLHSPHRGRKDFLQSVFLRGAAN